MIICSWSWSYDVAHNRCNCYFSLWAIFCPFNPLTAQKIRIKKKKNEKITWRYYHFTDAYQKFWSDDVLFLRYDMRWRDRDGRIDKQMVGHRKWHIEVGTPPKQSNEILFKLFLNKLNNWKSQSLFLVRFASVIPM